MSTSSIFGNSPSSSGSSDASSLASLLASLEGSGNSSSTSGAAAAAPITISGLASGINTSSIIQELVTAEGQAETVIQGQETTLNNQLSAWQQFNTALLSLQQQMSSLGSASTLDSAQATVSNSSVASATANNGAPLGSSTLSVQYLAQAETVLSGSFTSSTTPLGLSGSFVLNGETINITASDTIADVASAINNANAGVTASVLNISTGNYQMSLTSTNTGTANALSATDSSGSQILEGLGLIPSTGQTVGFRQAIDPGNNENGAGSIAFNSATTSLGTLLGATGGNAPSGTVAIGGVNVSLNLNTMSLNQIASAINAAGSSDIEAVVVAVPDQSGNVSNTSQQQLEIISKSGSLTPSSITDPNGILSTLGITQTSFANVNQAAQDAQFTLNGVQMVRSSNTFSDAIPGVTLSLLAAGTGTSESTNVDVTENSSAIVSAIQNFASAYNNVNDAINSQFAFTAPTAGSGSAGSSPPLFGDLTLTQIQESMQNTLSGLAGNTALANVGITTNSTGDVEVNTTTLTSALQSDPSSVTNLFQQFGSSSNPNVAYLSGTSATQASTGTGYAIDISQAATQASVTASNPQTGALAAPETLTFGGNLFGSTAATITLAQGNTLQQNVNQINSDSALNQYVYASQNAAGDLVISSQSYGSSSGFTLTSNQPSTTAGTSSGIGTALLTGIGQDVAGTIGGEAATGIGQVLTGNTTDTNAVGLSVQVTATAPGDYGSVTLTNGLANQLDNLITSFTNPINGTITGAENSINSQITATQSELAQMQTQLQAYQANLESEFANMETSVSQLQSQGNALTAEANGINGTSSSSSGSGGSSGSGSSGSSL